ncbi:MAG: acyl-CoA dehydrogenase family protein [Pseudomonadales bacterium]
MALLSEEQTLIKDQAVSWVRDESPVTQFRAMRDSGAPLGFFPDTWTAMVNMGWTGMLVPEAYGGSGLGHLTFGLVLEQLGRHLTASPLFASALVGASALMKAGSEAQKTSLLPKIADGSAVVSLALEERTRHHPEATALLAERSDDGFTLSGEKTFVMEGMAATHFVVVARTEGAAGSLEGLSLFLVDADVDGLSRSSLSTMDSRGYANLRFERVEVREDQLLGTLHQAGGALSWILDVARAGLAMEMLGTAAHAFDMTLDYLKTRKQFGQVIGSFQALGHRASGLYTEMELTRSCVEAALQSLDAESDERESLVALAKAKASAFLHEMSNQLIQIHGGIGMTDEFDAGFYLKRARVLEIAFGNVAYHKDRYATLNGF